MTKGKEITIKKKQVPKFDSLERESDFWGQHSPLDYGIWHEISYGEILKDLKEQSQRKRQVSLRLEPELVESLKKIARGYGIPYQKLARELLKRGVAGLSKT